MDFAEFTQRFKVLESRPDFKQLTYAQQVETRLGVLMKHAASIPEVVSLTPEDRNKFIKGVAARPPSFENESFKTRMQDTQLAFAAYKDPAVYKNLNPGLNLDEKGLQFMAAMEASAEASKSTLMGVGKSSMVVAGLVGAGRRLAKFVPGLYKELFGLLYGKDHYSAQYFGEVEKAVGKADTNFRDWDKWEAYTDYMLDEDAQLAGIKRAAMKGGAMFAATMADMFIIPGTTVTKATAGWKAASNFGRGALSAFRVAGNLGVETSLEVGRQYFLDYMKDSADAPLQVTWEKTNKLFGENVIGNVVGRAVLGGLAKSVGAAKHVISSKGMLTDVGYADLDDFTEAVRRTALGEDVDPVLLRGAGEGTLESVKRLGGYLRVGGLEAPSPEDVMSALAGANGWKLGKSGGGYFLTPVESGVGAHAFATFEGLQKFFATRIAQSAGKVGAELQASMAASKALTLNMTPGWVNHLALTEYGSGVVAAPGGRVLLNLPDGGVKDFDNSIQAGKWLLQDVLVDGKIPADLAPKLLVEDPKFTETDYMGVGVVKGTGQDLLKHLSEFTYPKSYGDVMLETSDGSKLVKLPTWVEVHDPTTASRLKFESPADAFKYLRGGWSRTEKIREAANNKLYEVDYVDNNWVLYTKGKTLGFKTLDEVEGALRGVPDPEVIPDLTGGILPKEMSEALGKQTGMFEYADTPKPKKAGLMLATERSLRPTDSAINTMVRDYGVPIEAGQAFRDVEVAKHLERTAGMKWNKHLAWTFTLPGETHPLRVTQGPRGNAKPLSEFLEVIDRDGAAQYLVDGKLDPRWMSIWDRKQVLTGKTSREGLSGFAEIGRDPTEGSFELGYVPRLVKKLIRERGNAWWGDDTSVVTFLKEAGVRDEHLPFFRHMRKAEMVDWAGMEDPIDALRTVIQISTRERYFNPALDRYAGMVNKLVGEGKLDGNVLGFLKDVEGFMSGKAFINVDRKKATSVIMDVVKRIPGLSKVETNNLTDFLSSAAYSSALGFRVYPVLRNLIEQPFLVLGPRVGFDYVGKAFKAVAADTGELFDWAVGRGLFQAEAPRLGGLSRKLPGLKRYTRTDDITRVVAYLSGKYRFDEAVDLMKAGKLTTPKAFLSRSGVSLMDDPLQKTVMDRLSKGDIEGAGDAFSRQLMGETMIPYWRAMNPGAIRGTNVVSKLYGRFGTFSYWWAENFTRGVTRGTGGQRLAYGLRFATASAMMVGATRSLGLRWQDYMPWSPAGFTGGPVFDLMVTALQSNPASDTYQSRQQRAKLLGIKQSGGRVTMDWNAFEKSSVATWGLPIPGRFMARSAMKAWEHMESGDYYKAMLAAAGAPINPQWTGWD